MDARHDKGNGTTPGNDNEEHLTDAEDTTEVETGNPSEVVELRARLGMRENRLRELYEEITAARLDADEARADRKAGAGYVEAVEREKGELKERIRSLEEELRGRRRRREGQERQLARLERELSRKDGEISHRDHLLERRADEAVALRQEAAALAARKDDALRDALRRIEGLERDLEEREGEATDLRATIEDLQRGLQDERETRERLAEPANRLRAGIGLFNESALRASVSTLSRTLGQPEVRVDLGDGEEPAVILTFTWQGVTWQTYAADPNPDVQEPRVYLMSSGEDLSGVARKDPNARVGPGGRVSLGL